MSTIPDHFEKLDRHNDNIITSDLLGSLNFLLLTKSLNSELTTTAIDYGLFSIPIGLTTGIIYAKLPEKYRFWFLNGLRGLTITGIVYNLKK